MIQFSGKSSLVSLRRAFKKQKVNNLRTHAYVLLLLCSVRCARRAPPICAPPPQALNAVANVAQPALNALAQSAEAQAKAQADAQAKANAHECQTIANGQVTRHLRIEMRHSECSL